jgi:starch phosphorylase
MKLSMNGAITIGTLDGANIEIADAVGPDGVFIFGLTVDQVLAHNREHTYDPRRTAAEDPRIARVLDAIRAGRFSAGKDTFRELIDRLLTHDPYYVLADFASFLAAQERAAAAFADTRGWARRMLLNVGGMGRFSSDRTIREYAEEIWRVRPVGPEASRST